MSLTTLAAIKEHLGIPTADTSEDASLTRLIRESSAIVRRYVGRYLGGVITGYTVANPTVVTSIGHSLRNGDTIVVSNSNGTTIDGERVITYLTPDTFSIPVNVAVAGTQGWYARKLTEFYRGTGSPELFLTSTPVQDVDSIYEDDTGYWGQGPGAFAGATLLTEGTDYALDRKNSALSLSGIVERLGGVWPNVTARGAGLLGAEPLPGRGNLKVTYTAGYDELPHDITLAVHQMISEVRVTGPMGGGLTSESLDYYSYSRASASEQAMMLTSAKATLRNYRPLIM